MPPLLCNALGITASWDGTVPVPAYSSHGVPAMNVLLVEFLIILALLLANGLFAMSELAMVTARRSRLQALATRGSRRARTALRLAEEPTAFLSSVQIGITLIGILAGAFGGARVAGHIQPFFAQFSWLASWSEEVAFGLVVGGITYLSLILGELVPKRLALSSPERVAMLVAPLMKSLARLMSPAVAVLSLSTNMVFRLLRLRASNDQAVTEEDIRALIAQGRAAGSVHAGEAEIVSRALRFGDRPVSAVMTPRTEIVWVDLEEPIEEIRRQLMVPTHRAVLVAAGSIDQVVGVLRIRDLLAPALRGEPLDIRPALRSPLFVPESLPLLRLVERFREAQTELAIVLDEYGGVLGLVTRTDVLDDLAMGLPGAAQGHDDVVVQREDGTWLVDGACSLQDFEDRTRIPIAMLHEAAGVRTVAGLILSALGRVPQAGEIAMIEGHRFEVVDMDGRRIDRLLVVPAPDRASPDEDEPV